MFAVETCTDIANEYGGDFGENFYIYFEELFEDVIKAIFREGLESEYQIRVKEMADSACDGYGHYDQFKIRLASISEKMQNFFFFLYVAQMLKLALMSYIWVIIFPPPVQCLSVPSFFIPETQYSFPDSKS